MSEYGKLIEIIFDRTISPASVSSLGFTISGEEYEYVGGILSPKIYTIDSIGIDETHYKILILISGWIGFNNAVNQISIEYDSAVGTIQGELPGSLPMQSWEQTFTPGNLQPIDNPLDTEALTSSLIDFEIISITITLVESYETEVISVGLVNILVDFIHIDDINP